MNYDYLIKEKVLHKVYGEGVIESIEDDYIDVTFKNDKKSKFSVPSCFDRFLKLVDKEKRAMMSESVLVWKESNGIFEKEMLRQKTIDTQAGIRRREEEREARRLQRAREVAERNRMFTNSDS